MKKAPCYQCNNRVLGCHSTCNEYKEYKNKVDSINNEINKERDKTAYVSNLKYNVDKAIRNKVNQKKIV